MAGSMRFCEILRHSTELCRNLRVPCGQLIYRGLRGGSRRVIPLNDYYADETSKKRTVEEDIEDYEDHQFSNVRSERQFPTGKRFENENRYEDSYRDEKFVRNENSYHGRRDETSFTNKNSYRNEKPFKNDYNDKEFPDFKFKKPYVVAKNANRYENSYRDENYLRNERSFDGRRDENLYKNNDYSFKNENSYARKPGNPRKMPFKYAEPSQNEAPTETFQQTESDPPRKLSRNAEDKQTMKEKLAKIFQLKTQPDPEELVTAENQHRKLAEVVTPLLQVPYEEQLHMKFRKNDMVLRTFLHRMSRNHVRIHRRSNGLPCVLEEVHPSPVLEKYRNKDEFNVQVGVDGDPKTVGFYCGSWDKQIMTVPGDEVVITKDSHKQIARAFQEYIRASPHPTCLKFKDGGVWRQIRVRSNEAGDLMAIVIIFPRDLTEAAILEEQEKLKEYFTSGPGKSCNLKSLYFQSCEHTRCTHEQSPYQLLFGETHLTETLRGLTFQISPESFFQCNKQAAEGLYDIITNIGIKDPDISVLDLCCGTGTIGLMMAQNAKQVVGIEALSQAAVDARRNAKINGIDNVKFYNGDVRTLINDACSTLRNEDVIAVVNPTRGGLNMNVIDALRKSKSIHQLIYISCQPEGPCMADFERLCMAPWGRDGKPFVLKRAVPVDLFPHTYHCELVLLFDHLL